MSRFVPSRTRPSSGSSRPVSSFSSVVLPAPFGPTIARHSPRCTLIEKSLTTVFGPKLLEIASASTTSLPDFGAAASASSAVPERRISAARSARISCRRRTRPMLRLRRAEMPSTAQRPSALISRSSLWRARSSSSQSLSRQSSKASKPRSSRRTVPRSTQSNPLVSRRRKARSWLISTSDCRAPSSRSSSQSIIWMSRWLVGSSSSHRSASCAISRASAARRRSPPEACAGSSSGLSRTPSSAASAR